MKIQKKRSLFAELSQGIEEITASKVGKITLRTTKIEKKPEIKADAEFIRQTREELHMSQKVKSITSNT